MSIHQATLRHPTDEKFVTLHSTLGKHEFRAILGASQQAGYVIVDFIEDMTDFRSSEGALLVLRALIPLTTAD
jgi:hypothetical protein